MDNVLGILLQIFIVYAAFKLGQWSILLPTKLALDRLARQKGIDITQVLEEIEAEYTDTAKSSEELMDVQRVNGVYFAYGDQGRFLAQGPDFRTMFASVKQRFPGQSFKINRYNPDLNDEEMGRLVQAVFETFGNDHDRNKDNKTR